MRDFSPAAIMASPEKAALMDVLDRGRWAAHGPLNEEEECLLRCFLPSGYASLLALGRTGLTKQRRTDILRGLAASGLMAWDGPASTWRLTACGVEVLAALPADDWLANLTPTARSHP